MAKIQSTVFLGFEDEEINENLKRQLCYSVNKVGGTPDFPNLGEVKISNCPVCNMSRPLILQVYAPLENSKFHRTLYVFSCLNPSCSVQSNCWLCIRVEHIEKSQDVEISAGKKSTKMNWCSGEDDWGEDEDCNDNEQNGNLLYPPQTVIIENKRNYSDEEDDSNSMENEILSNFGAMQVGDDRNANCAGAQGGVTVNIPTVFAEIEGAESEVVSVDCPKVPERDLIALMKHTIGMSLNSFNNLTLKSFFLAVEEESPSKRNDGISDDHIRELYAEYQKHDEVSKHSPTGGCGSNDGVDGEQYENAVPAHGDLTFYNFLEIIQSNPGQIVRYSRDALPLLTSPLSEPIPKCQYCKSDLICELQILPTIIPCLKFEVNGELAPVEFGNVLIFTCSKSCWDTPDKMRFEYVIVQQETL